MTPELAVSLVALIGSALTAGRVVFRSEVRVEDHDGRIKKLEDTVSSASTALTEIRVRVEHTEASVENVAGILSAFRGEMQATLSMSMDAIRKDNASSNEALRRELRAMLGSHKE